jgi:hypothetical protein
MPCFADALQANARLPASHRMASVVFLTTETNRRKIKKQQKSGFETGRECRYLFSRKSDCSVLVQPGRSGSKVRTHQHGKIRRTELS